MVTVNVEIFGLYIFSRYSRFVNIYENMHNLKITCVMPQKLCGHVSAYLVTCGQNLLVLSSLHDEPP